MPTINGMDVKREIIEKKLKGGDKLALLSGFSRSCLALVREGDGGFELCLDCQTEFVREYIASVMAEVFKVTPKENRTQNALFYSDCDRLLRGLMIVSEDGEFYDGVPDRFRRSPGYARGVFLGCGSMSAPKADSVQSQKSVGYHLEFSFNAESFAYGFTELLGEYGITAHYSTRAEKCVVYVKDSESVSDCLALLGAEKSVLRLNEAVAALAVKRDVVRRVNCEMANMGRTVRAAVGLTEAIELIDKRIGLDNIDVKLAVAARARLEDPEAPLSSVAERLKISKSGLKHRFDKITVLARSLYDEEGK